MPKPPVAKRTIRESPSTGRLRRDAVVSVVRAIHVAPSGDAWVVRKAGPKRVIKSFTSRDEAVVFAKKVKRNIPAEIIVHGQDGKVIRNADRPVRAQR